MGGAGLQWRAEPRTLGPGAPSHDGETSSRFGPDAAQGGLSPGVVRGLDGHLDVVRVALLEPGRGDPDEPAALLQLGHACAHPCRTSTAAARRSAGRRRPTAARGRAPGPRCPRARACRRAHVPLEVPVLGVGPAAPACASRPATPSRGSCLNCLPLMKTSSPGLSSQPASSEPSITVSAPATSALAMSPEYCSPPSAMTGHAGRPCTRAAAVQIAVTCGTPTPATTRVVQIEPGPTPTLTASAPASTRACAPSRVATLPPTTSTCAAAGSSSVA